MKHIILSLCSLLMLAVIVFAGVKVSDGDYTFKRGDLEQDAVVVNDGLYMEIGNATYIWNNTTEKYDQHPFGASLEFEAGDENTYNVVGGVGTLVKNES